jgi:hypothetical protein
MIIIYHSIPIAFLVFMYTYAPYRITGGDPGRGARRVGGASTEGVGRQGGRPRASRVALAIGLVLSREASPRASLSYGLQIFIIVSFYD